MFIIKMCSFPQTCVSSYLLSLFVPSDAGVPEPQQPGVLDGGRLHARLRLTAQEERGGVQEGEGV